MSEPMYDRAGLDWLADVQQSNGAKWARDEIERLDRELSDAQAREINSMGVAKREMNRANDLEAQAAAMRGVLTDLLYAIESENVELVGPLIDHTDGNQLHKWTDEWLHHANTVLSSDAGRKVLDVVDAARGYIEYGGSKALRQALAAMGK